ncbi:MAG: hypothetical protein J6I46_13030 [Ruminococcus sp.]|nr:hypothetical protein [Ruminococcus sp.]
MMKMTRKMAAMVAAMMAVSSIGAISAFAETTVPAPDLENNSQSTNVELKMKSNDNGMSSQANPIMRYWNVSISADELSWDIVRNVDGGTYDLQWNPVEHKYVKSAIVTNPDKNTYVLAQGTDAEKSVTIYNNSNFDLGISNHFDTTYSSVFTYSPGNISTISTGGSREDTVTCNINNMDNYIWNQIFNSFGNDIYAGVGRIEYTFTAGNLYENEGTYEAIN